MLYIASDHGGFKTKQTLFAWIQGEFGGRVEDLGPTSLNPKDDYPKFAKKVGEKVSSVMSLRAKRSKLAATSSGLLRRFAPRNDGVVGENLGILLCRSGQGVCIAANKFKGVRAALAWNVKSAKASRHDDHANVLCLPSDYITLQEAKKIITAWLDTPWGKEKKHKRRIQEINKLEAD